MFLYNIIGPASIYHFTSCHCEAYRKQKLSHSSTSSDYFHIKVSKNSDNVQNAVFDVQRKDFQPKDGSVRFVDPILLLFGGLFVSHTAETMDSNSTM